MSATYDFAVKRPSRESVTLADVAAVAGVSAMTVSRVVNGTGRVREGTRLRVEAAMESVGYVPNSPARSLVGRRLGLIALVVADITHPWFTELAHAVDVEAAQRGFTVVVGDTDDDPGNERTCLYKLSSLKVDGVLIAPSGKEAGANLDLLRTQNIPFVQIDRQVADVEADVVCGESYRAARQLTVHLLEHGHRQLAMVSGPRGVSTARDRERGFKAALRFREVDLEPRSVRRTAFTRGAGLVEARALLGSAEPPTAIMAANGFLALGVIDAARERGLRVPEDLAVVTFDDVESTATEPFLTCVEQPARGVGLAALDYLLSRIDGDMSPPRRTVLDGDLRIRRSCGCGAP